MFMMKSAEAFCFLAMLSACGEGAFENNYAPPRATLQGVIDSALLDAPTNVRVALVWTVTDFAQGGNVYVAQEVGIEARFPVSYELDVQALPPASAMNRVVIGTTPHPPGGSTPTTPSVIDSASSGAAFGTIVVYEDGNANGKLDISSLEIASAEDKILGVPADMTVVYVEGDDPPFPAGFSLWRDLKTFPISTPITIALTDAPELPDYICQGVGFGGTAVGTASAVPPGAIMTCSADGSSYDWKVCLPQKQLCPQECPEFGHQEVGSSYPADWPCSHS
jgi:hypothetical protein